MFRAASLMLLNRIDVLPHVDFRIVCDRRFSFRIDCPQLSATAAKGIDAWGGRARQQPAADALAEPAL